MQRREVVDSDGITQKIRTIFHEHERFQIVSAGRDRLYGNGGAWPLKHFPSGPEYAEAALTRQRLPGQWNDRDNITNFAETVLAVGE